VASSRRGRHCQPLLVVGFQQTFGQAAAAFPSNYTPTCPPAWCMLREFLLVMTVNVSVTLVQTALQA
jgi:hypothetical protein